MNRILSGAPFSAGWTGIDVAYKHNAVYTDASHTIVRVGENSPASRAGVKVGDQIWFVGPDNTGYIDTPTVAKKLLDANPEVVIKVRRAGDDKLLSFTIKRDETIASRRLRGLPGSGSVASNGQTARSSSEEPLPEPPAPDPQRTAAPDLIALLGKGPKENAQWGLAPGDGPGEGVTIKRVGKGTPADAAGLVAGDILLSVDDTPIENAKDWQAKRNAFPLFTPLSLQVQRNGQIINTSISLTGTVRLDVKPVLSDFVIPGVPSSSAPAPTAIDALDDFNILDRVFLNPDTGEIAVLGHYDPRFATGSIPYLDLLKTALVYPVPRISISPTPETAKLLHDIKPETAAKLSKFPFHEAVDLVQGHPAAERDRQLLIRQLARRYGLAPEEYAAWYNFARLDVQHDNYRGILPPAPLRAIIPLAYRNMGFTVAADALELLYKDTPESTLAALQLLGLAAGVEQGADAYEEQTMRAFLAVAVKVGALPTKTRDALIGMHEEKRLTWQDVVRISESVMPFKPKGKQLDFMRLAFNHIVLSDPIGLLMFPEVKQARSYMDPTDLNRNSQLTRIMFAADYALKSTAEYPELFAAAMPDFQNLAQFRVHSRDHGDARSDRIWLEPQDVGMNISPNRHLVDFTHSRIRVKTDSYSEVINYGEPDDEKPDPYLNWLCRHIMDHYDQYAHILPSLHEVRETAKIIALAQWLNKEGIDVDLGDVTQTEWRPPKPFPVMGLISQSDVRYPDGSLVVTAYLTAEGGVVFRPMGSWTTMTPAPQSETKAMDSLQLSAGLGQQAEKAVQAGDMETARHLADLSAQAMSGSLTSADLAKSNIPVPPAPASPGVLSPAAVQSQKEAIQQVYREIAARKTGTVPVASAPAASDLLHQLQAGQTMPDQEPAPLPEVAEVPEASPPTDIPQDVCSVSLAPTETVPEDQRAYLDNKLAETKNRLRYINEALKKLIALNQAQRDQIAQLTGEISKDYEAATERAYDFAVGLLTDLPLSKYAELKDAHIAELENFIKAKNLLRTVPMSERALKAVEDDISTLTVLKDDSAQAYAALGRLLDIYDKAGQAKGIYEWDEKTRDGGVRQRGLQAALVLGKVFVDHPWLEKLLKNKEWFDGNKLWQVKAIGKMAWTASDFFWDIMHQYVAWGPLAAGLQKGLEANSAGMERLRLEAQENERKIQCLQALIR